MPSLLETANKNALKIFLIAAAIIIAIFIIAVNLKPETKPEPIDKAAGSTTQVQVSTPQPAAAPTKLTQEKKTTKSEPTSQEYSKKITRLLKQDLKTADAHLAIEGTTKWLFVTLSYSEWKSMGTANQKEMVSLLLRNMKQAYSYGGIQVSVGVNADQPLAEGSWSQFRDEPEVRLIGE